MRLSKNAQEVAFIKAREQMEREHRAAVQKARKDKLNGMVAKQLVGLPEFEPEHQFHPTRKWRFDYAWPQRRIALEVHGGVFTKGRHTRGAGFTGDREKMNEAACLGWLVIEVSTEQLKAGLARDWVERALALRGA